MDLQCLWQWSHNPSATMAILIASECNGKQMKEADQCCISMDKTKMIDHAKESQNKIG